MSGEHGHGRARRVAAVEAPRPGVGEPGLEPLVADPRAVRVVAVEASRLASDRPMVVAPGAGVEGSVGIGPAGATPPPLVDGLPVPVRLERRDASRAVLVEGDGREAHRTRLLLGPLAADEDGRLHRELVVDGWRVEVEVEHERRAALRERARRVGEAAGHGGPIELRAIIPGRVVGVDASEGATIEAGQRLLVIEAMKMQNELRAPRSGTLERVAVTAGDTVELGDLLLVIR